MAVENEKQRPLTTKLDKPTNASFDLPHIQIPTVQTQTTPHLVS